MSLFALPQRVLEAIRAQSGHRQPGLEQGLGRKSIDVSQHSLFNFRHCGLLLGLDVRQTNELPRLDRSAIKMDGSFDLTFWKSALCRDSAFTRSRDISQFDRYTRGAARVSHLLAWICSHIVARSASLKEKSSKRRAAKSRQLIGCVRRPWARTGRRPRSSSQPRTRPSSAMSPWRSAVSSARRCHGRSRLRSGGPRRQFSHRSACRPCRL